MLVEFKRGERDENGKHVLDAAPKKDGACDEVPEGEEEDSTPQAPVGD